MMVEMVNPPKDKIRYKHQKYFEGEDGRNGATVVAYLKLKNSLEPIYILPDDLEATGELYREVPVFIADYVQILPEPQGA